MQYTSCTLLSIYYITTSSCARSACFDTIALCRIIYYVILTYMTLRMYFKGFSFEAVQLVVKSIAKNEKLWSRYFGDFVLYKLQLGSEEKSESIGYKILYHVFETHKVHGLEALQRVVSLHCYAHVHHLNLAKMVPRLRPLNELQKVCTDYYVKERAYEP